MTSTLLEVISEASRLASAGFESTCTSAGTTTTLIDLVTSDEGVDVNFAQGGWIYRPDALTAADQVRRIESYDATTGTFTIARAWADAPDNAEAYQVFSILPPIIRPGISESWQRLVNRGLSAMWFNDEIIIGSGDGTQTRFTLSDDTGWVPVIQQIQRVIFRQQADNGEITDIDQTKNGRWWRIVHGAAGAQLQLSRVPAEEQDVVVSVTRQYPQLATMTAETSCSLDLIAARTKYELYNYLNGVSQSVDQYKSEMAKAYADWRSLYKEVRPSDSLVLG